MTRIEDLDWAGAAERLWASGYALLPSAAGAEECAHFAAMYDDDALFRSTVQMHAHGFGQGEYRYFDYPLPAEIGALREVIYAYLAPAANAWNEALGQAERYPLELSAYLDRCLGAGQRRPTPLLLKYVTGDYNRLHQNVYGALAFPLQATLYLSGPGDYTGGETVLTMQRPRLQSRAEVILPQRGDLLLFANRYRPIRGANGFYRENVRHGISEVRSGVRFALGLIFHDAA